MTDVKDAHSLETLCLCIPSFDWVFLFTKMLMCTTPENFNGVSKLIVHIDFPGHRRNKYNFENKT